MNDELYQNWYEDNYETLRERFLQSMSKEELIEHILDLDMEDSENIFGLLEHSFADFIEQAFDQEMECKEVEK